MGLAISRAIVEAHGGRLTAAGAGRYRGSAFTLELVTAPAPAPAAPVPPRTPAADRPLRILLVEDNMDTLRYLDLVLSKRQHVVRPAGDLSSARVLAAAEHFDLLVSDIQLPDGTGLELMSELRETRSIPGIAVSGFGSEDDRRLSRAAGFAMHLTKPIDVRALEEAIAGLFREVDARNGGRVP